MSTRVIEQKSSGTWWKCLLAFLGGILFTVVLLVGGGVVAGTMVPTGDLLGQYSSYLSEEFQQMTITDIVMGIVGGDIKFNNLSDINRISPEVAKLFDAINESFANAGLNVRIEFDDLKDEPWKTLDVKLIETFKEGITLADVLGINESSEKILKYFSFPKNTDGTYDYDNPYTLATFMDDENFFPNLIDNLTIGDVITADPDNLLMQAIADFTIADLKDTEKVYGIKLASLFTEEDRNNNPLLQTIADKDWTIKDLTNKDNFYSIELGLLFTDDQKAGNPLLTTIANKHWTIDDLTDSAKIKSLKINEIMDPTPGSILDAIGEKSIAQLDGDEHAFDDIEVGTIVTIDDSSSPIMKYLEHKTLADLKDDDLINSMYISDIFTQADIDASKVLSALNNLDNPDYDPAEAAVNPDYNVPAKGCKVGEIGDRVNELKLKDVMDISGDNKIIDAIKDYTIDELPDAIDDLELADVFDYYRDPVSGKYYTDNTKASELAPVLVKLIGGEPVDHPYPGYHYSNPATIYRTVNHQDYEYICFNDGSEDNKTDLYKISDFLQNTTIDVTYDDVSQKWIATGSGTADPARNIYCESFEVVINYPVGWADQYYCISNKPTRVNDLSDAVDDLRIKDVMVIEEGSVFNNDRIKNTPIDSANNLFDIMKEELSLGDVIDIDGSSSLILQSLKDTKLGEIGGEVDNLTLGDVVEINGSSSKILRSLENTQIGDLDDEINNLSIDDVIDYHGPVYDSVNGRDIYYTDNTMSEELPQILVKLVGGEPSDHPFPGYEATTTTITIERTINKQFYSNIVFSDGTNDKKTGYLDIADFLQNSEINISYDSINNKWIATGSGTTARDPNVDSFTIDVNYPAGWANHYYSICNKSATIDNMSDSISDLTIGDVLTTDQRDNRFLATLPASTKITEIGDGINNLKFVDVFEDQIFDTENTNTLQSTWKYLLIESTEPWIVGNPTKDSDPLAGHECLNYTVGSGLNKMMDNMKVNMERASLNELDTDGIVDVDDAFLDKDIPSYLLPYASGHTKYGQLNILEFTTLVNKMTDYLP